MEKNQPPFGYDRPAESLTHLLLPHHSWTGCRPFVQERRTPVHTVSFRTKELRPVGGNGLKKKRQHRTNNQGTHRRESIRHLCQSKINLDIISRNWQKTIRAADDAEVNS